MMEAVTLRWSRCCPSGGENADLLPWLAAWQQQQWHQPYPGMQAPHLHQPGISPAPRKRRVLLARAAWSCYEATTCTSSALACLVLAWRYDATSWY